MYWKRLLRTILIGLFTSLQAGGTAAGAPAAIAESQQTAVDEEQQAVESTAGGPAAGGPAAVVTAAVVTAAVATADANETKETAEEDSKTEPQPSKTPQRRRAVSRNFRPSEQITADNSVAYPVDI